MPFIKVKSPYNLYFGEGIVEYQVWVNETSETTTPSTSTESPEVAKLKKDLADALAKITALETKKAEDNDEEQHYKSIEKIYNE